MKLGELFITLTLDKEKFDKDSAKAMSDTAKAAQAIESKVRAKTIMLGNLMTSVVKKGFSLIGSFAQMGMSYNAQIETYTANLATMLGSTEKAAQKMEAIKAKAKATPYDVSDFAEGTQTLLAYGVQADKTETILSQLGDVAMGDKNKFATLNTVFGQVSIAGKLLTQDYKQLINVGFNPLDFIVKRVNGDLETYGKTFQQAGLSAADWNALIADGNVSLGEMSGLMSKGVISSGMVEQALADATSEGEKYYKGAENGSKTLTGLWEQVKAAAAEFAGTLMEPVAQVAEGVMPTLKDEMELTTQTLLETLGLVPKQIELEPAAMDGVTKTSQAWLDELNAVWTDGEKESDEIIQSFVEGFNGNTAELEAALAKRWGGRGAGGVQNPEYVQQIEQLKQYDEQIQTLLAEKQNGYFTEEDQKQLQEIVAAKTELETTLSESLTITEPGSNPMEDTISGLIEWIEDAGEAVRGFISGDWQSLVDKIAAFKEPVSVVINLAGDIIKFLAKYPDLALGGAIFIKFAPGVASLIKEGISVAKFIGNKTGWWGDGSTPSTPAPSTSTPSTPSTSAPASDSTEKSSSGTPGMPATTPKTETPKTKTPKTETPKTKTPKTETPKTETPKTETPKTETPKTETPKTETPTPKSTPSDIDSLPHDISPKLKSLDGGYKTPADTGTNILSVGGIAMAAGLLYAGMALPGWINSKFVKPVDPENYYGTGMGYKAEQHEDLLTRMEPLSMAGSMDEIRAGIQNVESILNVPRAGEFVDGKETAPQLNEEITDTVTRLNEILLECGDDVGLFQEKFAELYEEVESSGESTEEAASATDNLADSTSSLNDSLASGAEGAESLAGASESAASAMSGAGAGASSLEKALAVAAARISNIRISAPGVAGAVTREKYATGGVFTRPTLLGQDKIVGEAGMEAVLPLQRLWDEMGARITYAMSAGGGIDYDRLAAAMDKRRSVLAIDGYALATRMAERNALAINGRDTVIARGMGGV